MASNFIDQESRPLHQTVNQIINFEHHEHFTNCIYYVQLHIKTLHD